MMRSRCHAVVTGRLWNPFCRELKECGSVGRALGHNNHSWLGRSPHFIRCTGRYAKRFLVIVLLQERDRNYPCVVNGFM